MQKCLPCLCGGRAGEQPRVPVPTTTAPRQEQNLLLGDARSQVLGNPRQLKQRGRDPKRGKRGAPGADPHPSPSARGMGQRPGGRRPQPGCDQPGERGTERRKGHFMPEILSYVFGRIHANLDV